MPPRRKSSSQARPRTLSARQTVRGRQLEALVLEVLGAFFDLRSVGQKEGLVNQSGAGTWGLLKILKEDGPKTVPAVARMRTVSRQYIQKLANELIEGGLIEMADNPVHKRSKLMRLTSAGEQRFDQLTQRLREMLEGLAGNFRTRDLRSATDTLIELRKQLLRSE